jgi:hypothetical protein
MISDSSLLRRARTTARPDMRGAAAAAVLATAAVAASVLLAACSSSDSPESLASSTSWSVGTPTGSGGSPSGGSGSGPPSAWGTAGATSGGVPPSGPRPSGPPAQDPADATRDRVPAAVAALPSPERVRQVARGSGGYTRVTVPGDGVWMISRPSGASPGYAEVLHLDGDGRIRRAYPFAGVAPQWLVVTPGAVYCGRRGDAAAPDAMVCRVDRTSGELRVLVTADGTPHTALVESDLAGRPGLWVLDDSNYTADLGVAPQVGAELTFSSGGVLRLSPDTLGVLGS